MLDAATTPRIHANQPDSGDHLGCIRYDSPRWAVLATYSQAEAWAEANLRARGHQPYLPRYAATVRDRVIPSLRHTVSRCLFPGYIFVQHDPADPWRPLRYCPGIRANLLGGNGIQYVRAGAVGALQAGDALRATPQPPAAAWRPGAVCRVATGIMAGFPGVVLSVRHDMALVSLMFLGQLREISLPVECLVVRDE